MLGTAEFDSIPLSVQLENSITDEELSDVEVSESSSMLTRLGNTSECNKLTLLPLLRLGVESVDGALCRKEEEIGETVAKAVCNFTAIISSILLRMLSLKLPNIDSTFFVTTLDTEATILETGGVSSTAVSSLFNLMGVVTFPPSMRLLKSGVL